MVSAQVRPLATSRHAWFIGGALLLATVVLGAAAQPLESLIGAGGIGRTALYAAALVVFAFGVRGSGSVTARRPLGTVALTLLAGWLLLGSVLSNVLSASFSNDAPPAALLEFGYVDSFVQFTAALVAVIQIARAGVVPTPWNWAPAWALTAVSVPWVLTRVIAAGATQDTASPVLLAVAAVEGLTRVGAAMLLGVLAIVLADRSVRTQIVPVLLRSE